ncbi:MAG: ABC transporter ATP-binding protein [Granulosicoccus sp.]
MSVSANEESSKTSEILLEAHGLTRRLSESSSVQDLSLELKRGDVLGLLGLNGAGKSSTLRMLCGILVPDSGSVSINGYSMTDSPLRARAHVGYLPDQPPLYTNMRVNEYLKLAGRIRGLKEPDLSNRLTRVTDQCSLGEVSKQLIGSLSKGYKQRVGLAQALIHEPAVVLLDEPSNGLDPQQMESMRNLIRQVGQDQSILFSTHLLSEAKATCNRIAIIHDGRLVADRPANGDDLEILFHGATT